MKDLQTWLRGAVPAILSSIEQPVTLDFLLDVMDFTTNDLIWANISRTKQKQFVRNELKRLAKKGETVVLERVSLSGVQTDFWTCVSKCQR